MQAGLVITLCDWLPNSHFLLVNSEGILKKDANLFKLRYSLEYWLNVYILIET